MALTSTETSLCNKMMGDYAGLVAPIKANKASIIGKRNDLLSQLAGTGYTPPSTLADRLNEFKNQVGSCIPDPTDLNSLQRMLENCDYFGNLGGVASVAGTLSSALSSIDSKINNFGATTGEFNAANIASAINQALDNLLPGGSGLTDLMKKIDALLNCLSTVCAAGDPEYIGGLDYITSDFNSTLSGMGLVDDPASSNYGKMNYGQLFSEAGLSEAQAAAITTTTEVIDQQKARAKTAIDETINSVKTQVGRAYTTLEGIF